MARKAVTFSFPVFVPSPLNTLVASNVSLIFVWLFLAACSLSSVALGAENPQSWVLYETSSSAHDACMNAYGNGVCKAGYGGTYYYYSVVMTPQYDGRTNNMLSSCWNDPVRYASCVLHGFKAADGQYCPVGDSVGADGLCSRSQKNNGRAANTPDDLDDDQDCNKSPANGSVSNPINVANGNKYQLEVDFTSFIGDMPLTVSRSYNSLSNSSVGIFGNNWSSSLDPSASINLFNNIVKVRLDSGRLLVFTYHSGLWVAQGKLKATLEKTGDEYTLKTADHTKYRFDDSGKIIVKENPFGHSLHFFYNNTSGRLETVTDHYGNILRLTYTASGYVQTVALMGQVFSYHYDESGSSSNGNLQSVDYPAANGGVVTRTYLYEDEAHPRALTGVVDESNERFATWRYDIFGRANYAKHGVSGEIINIEYSSRERYPPTASVTNAAGFTWNYVFDVDEAGYMRLNYVEDNMGPDESCRAGNSFNSYNQNGFVETVTHGHEEDVNNSSNGYVSKRKHNSRGYITENTVGYKWLNNNPYQNNVGNLIETPEMKREETLWHLDFPKKEWIRLSGKVSSGQFQPYREIDPEYLSNGRLKSVTVTDLTAITSPYPTNGRSRTWGYSYSYHDAEQTKVSVKEIDGPRLNVNDITRLHYDSRGRLIKVVNGLSHETLYRDFNSVGLPGTIIDFNGVSTSLLYDARNRIIESTVSTSTSVDAQASYEYYPNGLLARVTMLLDETASAWTHYTYNAARDLIRMENNLGDYIVVTPNNTTGEWQTKTYYDNSHNLKKMEKRQFDELGRLSSLLYSDDSPYKQFINDGSGLEVSSLAGDLAPTHAVTKLYDSLKRLKEVSHEDGGASTYSYDEQGNIKKITAPNNVTTEYLYDGFGQLIRLTSPDTGVISYTFDEAGNRLTQTNAKGVTLLYAYDALNRLLSRVDSSDPAGVGTMTYDYDDTLAGGYGLGRLTGSSDSSGEVHYRYDSLGRVIEKITEISGKTYRWGYTYDMAGNLSEHYYPSGRIARYERDILGRITAVYTRSWPAAEEQLISNNFSYLPFGPVQSFDYANGVSRLISRDQDYQLQDFRDEASGGSSVVDWTFTFYATGNIAAIDDNDNNDFSQTFIYDPASRLEVAAGSYGIINYNYDLAGNRLRRAMLSPLWVSSQEEYIYTNGSNHLTKVSDGSAVFNYLYDAVGNLSYSSKTGATHRYDLYGRLRAVVGGSNGDADYQINALGQRVEKSTAPGIGIHYHYDQQGRLVGEYDKATSAMRVEYIYANAQPIAQLDQSSIVDADGDGMDDDWEQQHFGDLSLDGLEDVDGDGLNAQEEFIRGFDPTVIDADSDGDGLLDINDNCVHNFNPGQTDADGDRVGDLCEVLGGGC